MPTPEWRWYNSAPVQAALAAVGESDGTQDWLVSLAERLLVETDTRADLDIEDMLEAVATWKWHMEQPSHWPRGMPTTIPRMLLTREVSGRTMDFEHCAWLLGVSPRALEEVMWHSFASLRADAKRVMAGERVIDVRKPGKAQQTLREYLRLRHGHNPDDARGSITSDVLAMAMHWIEEDGRSVKEAHTKLHELGAVAPSLRYDSFRKRVARARASTPSAPSGARAAA